MTCEELRDQIPFLKTVSYLDSASVVPACRRVLDEMDEYAVTCPLNYGVGEFPAAREASERVDRVRRKLSGFIHARGSDEIVFTKNTTEAINQVAYGISWKEGDEIILTSLEHQSNLMPWMRLEKERGIVLKIAQADKEGVISPGTVKKLVTSRTRLINVTYVSNIYGTITPVEEIGKIAREANTYYMIDAAQAGGRIPMDVQRSGCDFMAVCGRKSMMGPQGTGALYMRREIADQIRPMNIGSRAGHVLDKEHMILNAAPYRFEAGVLNTAGVIGLGAAVDVLNEIGCSRIQSRITEMTQYMIDGPLDIPEVELYGTRDASRIAGVISWNVKGRSSKEIASALGRQGVAVACGAQGSTLAIAPLGIDSVIRTSVHCFTVKEDIDALIVGLRESICHR